MTDLTVALTGFSVPTVFDALVKEYRALRARRATRMSYRTMLELDPHLLFDLGVTERDLREAIRHPASTARTLELRRRHNATRPLAPHL